MLAKYRDIMEKFIEGKLSADDFQTLYLKIFVEWDDRLNVEEFEILNGVFIAADCYWHECFSGQETAYVISEEQLRKEVNEALEKLNVLMDLP
ncbi:colicin immunity domain-containing protein [Planococcus sp. YIM B11945]|uniref:colicin immunity domain-containing protein n=1 Tax=Planococcus sp. YIM B11945 TaxID=3435410 RepID=UPI003D7D60BA